MSKRTVVHVDVNRDPAHPGHHLGKYTISGNNYEKSFKAPKPLIYSRELHKDVRARLKSNGTARAAICIWRGSDVREIPTMEKWVARGVFIFLAIAMIVLVASILSIQFIELLHGEAPMDSTDLLTSINVAIAGATGVGIFLVRILKFSDPIEVTKMWLLFNLGPIMLVMLFNLTLLYGFFEFSREVDIILAMIGWVAAAAISVMSAAIGTLRWTSIEHIQGEYPAVRPFVDRIRFREAA